MNKLPEIICVAENAHPPAEAAVDEEDVWLVLGTKGPADSGNKPVDRLVRDAAQFAADAPVPGLALARAGKPLRFLAVIHDFSQTPSCRKEWVEGALADVFEQAERRGIRSLRLPLLGVTRGPLSPQEFIDLLYHALKGAPRRHLKIVYLEALAENQEEAAAAAQSAAEVAALM